MAEDIKLGSAKEVNVKADPKRVQDAKENTQVVTDDELNFLMPLMAGKLPSEEDAKRAEELMNRDVKLGSVIQVASYMDGILKMGMYSMMEDMIDTISIHKAVFDALGVQDTVKKEADAYYEKKKEAIKLRQEVAEKAKEADSKDPVKKSHKAHSKAPVKKSHKTKQAKKVANHESKIVDLKTGLS